MNEELLKVFLPKGILEWFDVKKIEDNGKKIRIIFEEKNVVPNIPEEHRGKKITSKKFKRILTDDFPIRGKKTEMEFLRRRWRIEGVPGLLKRDIKLVVPGTTLAEDFAAFLKELSRE